MTREFQGAAVFGHGANRVVRNPAGDFHLDFQSHLHSSPNQTDQMRDHFVRDLARLLDQVLIGLPTE